MKAEITYIFHNCFLLKLPDRTFLFDYPHDKYLTKDQRELVISKIRSENLFVFSSHKHQDHYNPKVAGFKDYAAAINLIFSREIGGPYWKYSGLDCCFLNPDQEYEIQDLQITTFKSTDLGVAFLIRLKDYYIYHGGDLANWNWDELKPREKRDVEVYYQGVLETLAQHRISIAFSNADQRLPNWAGALEFIEMVKPALFIPMHTFGETKILERFKSEITGSKGEVFLYRETGDSIKVDI